MVKSKVGAEPKKRIKHIFCQHEGIHEGIHRDEPGWFESNRHPYCFGYGYFFHRGSSLAEQLTPEYIKEHWDEAGWYGSLKNHCMAIIDRKRKIAVIKVDTEYAWYIERGLPSGYSIYKTDEAIPIYDITETKNKKVLINTYIKYIIKKYIETFYNEYKVLNSISKYIPDESYTTYNRTKYFNLLKYLSDKYRFVPKVKRLSNKDIYIGNIKIPFPSIKDILNDNLFTDEQKLHIKKCKFYTKFCYCKGISWKELNKNWSDEYIAEIEAKDKANYKAFLERVEKYNIKAEANHKAALLNSKNNIDYWRKGNNSNNISYIDYYVNEKKRSITPIRRVLLCKFNNTQLRIKPSRPNWVETSRGAIVPLDAAIRVFNQLYTNYILSGKTKFEFKNNEFKIGSFIITECAYIDKITDNIASFNIPNTLGYKEWYFKIGCHTLWFDDIKDFARYYNLQDKLSFPIDKTTSECMENHLIYVSNVRTIKAIGTVDV
ncbi:hypothetical protein [Phocaeicola coprophilus]|uniref:hypothetical protein n=1 Tax=Phocaeicola coprophilus TaxID=387090 RepID=UPI0030773713